MPVEGISECEKVNAIATSECTGEYQENTRRTPPCELALPCFSMGFRMFS